MLGLLLVFFIGKYFYELAQDYYKHRWLYAILGVASYYFGAIVIGGVVVGLAIGFFSNTPIDNYSEMQMTLMVFPFGIAFAYLFYFLLKRNWKNSKVEVKDEIQDIGISIDKDDV